MLKYDEVVMDIVRALLVFGASVDLVNKENFSVRHIVSCQTKDHKLLRTLSDIGAKRCPVQSPVPSLTMRKLLNFYKRCENTYLSHVVFVC